MKVRSVLGQHDGESQFGRTPEDARNNTSIIEYARNVN